MELKIASCLCFISLFWTMRCEELKIICPSEDHPDKCCAGYRKINGSCTACIGFFGQNCEEPCPSSNFGPKCSGLCNCTENEECNPFVGCFPNINVSDSYYRTDDNYSHPDPFLPSRSDSCSLLLLLVIVLSGSQIVILIFCVTTLCLKCCTLPPQRTNTSLNITGQSITMTMSKSNLDMSELHSGKETPSRFRGILSETENTNGAHYLTLQERQMDALQYPSNHYDTCSTAERIKEHSDDNWNVKRQSGMYALPGDSHQDAQKTTMVTLTTAQSSLRPYNLVDHEANTDQRQSVHQNNYFTLKPMYAS